ncbi:MAG: hypothetical protein GX245_01690 [Eubacteriaceae bacterium]|jgi:hypothetical protein|nr:hypothetical protein [Eubacteriaceae bacterium]
MEKVFIFIGIGIFAVFFVSFLYQLIRKGGKFVAVLGMIAGIVLMVAGYFATEAADTAKPVNKPANRQVDTHMDTQSMPEEQIINTAKNFVTPFLNLPQPITFQQSQWQTKQIGTSFEVKGRAISNNNKNETEIRDFVVELSADKEYRLLTPQAVWVDDVKVYPK